VQTEIFTCFKEPCPEGYSTRVTAACCVWEKENSVTALKALRSLPPDSLDDDVKRAATQIYYQLGRRYDSSSRTLAADILLESRPDYRALRDLLLSLASRADPAYEIIKEMPAGVLFV
jgi:hypothetical protein